MEKLVRMVRNHLHGGSQAPAIDISGNSGFSATGEPQQLSAAISAGRDVRKAVDSLASAQHTTVQQLLRWASREPNAAIRDVVHQISELDFLWLESQTDFKAELADFERTLSRIVDIEEQSVNCVAKVKKETKVKGPQRQLLANVQNSRVPPINNSQADQEQAAQAVLRENEVQKLLHLKKCLSTLAKAYVTLGEHCSVIFEAQRRIASLLPDAEASLSECPQLSDVRYEGAEESRHIVAATRAKLSKSNGGHKKCTCHCGGRRHRSTSRVRRRCSEPVPYRFKNEDSDSEYEDDDSGDNNEQEMAPVLAPPPYNLASAPAMEQKDVTALSSKLEEVMNLTSSSKPPQPSLYPPIPTQSSIGWPTPPPPYLVNQQQR